MRRVAISAGVRTSPCRPSITKYQITRPRTSLRSLGGLVGNRQRRRASTIGRIRDVAARSPLSRLTESPIISEGDASASEELGVVLWLQRWSGQAESRPAVDSYEQSPPRPQRWAESPPGINPVCYKLRRPSPTG